MSLRIASSLVIEIVGTYGLQLTRLEVVVPARGHRSAVMYFPVEGETRPFREAQP